MQLQYRSQSYQVREPSYKTSYRLLRLYYIVNFCYQVGSFLMLSFLICLSSCYSCCYSQLYYSYLNFYSSAILTYLTNISQSNNLCFLTIVKHQSFLYSYYYSNSLRSEKVRFCFNSYYNYYNSYLIGMHQLTAQSYYKVSYRETYLALLSIKRRYLVYTFNLLLCLRSCQILQKILGSKDIRVSLN